MKIECTFEPQIWGGLKQDYAYPADPEGDLQWTVGMDEVTSLTGVSDMDDMDDMDNDPCARDELRRAASAPKWIKEWHGPFEISWKIM